jgi:predicted hydrocarbon binding protein
MPFKVQRFEDSLEAHVDSAVKAKLMEGCEAYDTLKTSVQTAHWIKNLMDRLNEAVGEDVAAKVMETCGRQCIGRSVLEKARKCKKEASDLDDLLDRLNQAHIGGGRLRREGDVIHASYTRCYCGSVSKTRKPISSTYCYCSCGWYKTLFETVLAHPVEVELLSSIAQGADVCRFAIRI